jgi:hypothetical protein
VHRKLARSVLGGVVGKVPSSDGNSLATYSTARTVWSGGKGGDLLQNLTYQIFGVAYGVGKGGSVTLGDTILK